MAKGNPGGWGFAFPKAILKAIWPLMLCRGAVVAGCPGKGGRILPLPASCTGKLSKRPLRSVLGQQSNASAAIGLQLQFLAQVIQPTVNYADLIACHGHNPVTRLEFRRGPPGCPAARESPRPRSRCCRQRPPTASWGQGESSAVGRTGGRRVLAIPPPFRPAAAPFAGPEEARAHRRARVVPVPRRATIPAATGSKTKLIQRLRVMTHLPFQLLACLATAANIVPGNAVHDGMC